MPEELTLDEVAQALGVHYMTVYKYVRTGRLPAHRRAGRWHVSALDIAAWQARQHDAETLPAHPRRDWIDELVGTIVGGSESAAWAICTSALASSHTPESLYLDVLAPTMRRVGDGWADGSVTVAQEHRASAVMTRLIGRLGPQFVRPGRPKGHVILGCPSGDTHALASALLADPLRGRGLDVIDLGADTPVESFLEALSRAEDMRPSGTGPVPDVSGEASSPPVGRRRKPGRQGASVGVVITSPIGLQAALDLMARVRAAARGTVVLGGLQVEGIGAAAGSDPRLVGVTLSTTYHQALDLLAPRVSQPAAVR